MAKPSKRAKSAEAGRPPVAKIRIGLINASIWRRKTDKGTFYSVIFERRYKDSRDEWQSTTRYDTDDLLMLAKLADVTHSKILELQSEDTE